MQELMIFENQQVEVFEINSSIRNFNEKQVIKLSNSDVKNIDIRKLNNAGENFLTEIGVYKLIFKSHKAAAERFQDWISDEVLPSIRKTGSYSTTENSKEERILSMIENMPNDENKNEEVLNEETDGVF